MRACQKEIWSRFHLLYPKSSLPAHKNQLGLSQNLELPKSYGIIIHQFVVPHFFRSHIIWYVHIWVSPIWGKQISIPLYQLYQILSLQDGYTWIYKIYLPVLPPASYKDTVSLVLKLVLNSIVLSLPNRSFVFQAGIAKVAAEPRPELWAREPAEQRVD